MSDNYQNFRNLRLITLLCAGNFLAAFANGTLLHYEQRKDPDFVINLETVSDMVSNPLLSLLVGTIIGLAVVKYLRGGKWSQWASGLASLSAVVTSLLLLWCYHTHLTEFNAGGGHYDADYHDWVFFPLLCMRFGLSFASRSFRSDVAAGHKRKIGWVELTYALGMILGFLLWVDAAPWALYVPPLFDDFRAMLVLDILILLTAGVLDMLSNPNLLYKTDVTGQGARPALEPWENRPRYLAAAVVVIALTVGIQMVVFAFRRADESLHYTGLAAFYFGAAVASLLYGSFLKVELRWPQSWRGNRLFGLPEIGLGARGRYFSLAWATALATAVVLLAVLAHWLLARGGYQTPLLAAVLTMIAGAAFLFEIIALVLFKWVGEEGVKTRREGLVALMLGSMGVGGTISLYLLSIPHDNKKPLDGWYASWITTSVACLVVATLAVPVANLVMKLWTGLSRARSKMWSGRDGPSGGDPAAEVVSLSSPGIPRTAAGETAAAPADA